MVELNIAHPRGPSFNAEGVEVVWSSTTIKLAETCLRKYQYKMIERWNPKGSSVHLRFGAHYATAVEHFYKAKAGGASHDEALRLVVREALENTWDNRVCISCGGTGHHYIGDQGDNEECLECSGTGAGTEGGAPWESGDNLKTRGTLIRSIVWYLEQFREDPAAPIILADGKPAVELSVLLPVDNGIIFSAHLDRLAMYADNPYVMDEKTTKSTISQYYFDQYKPDTQMSLYTFLGKAAFGIPVKGVIIDAAQIAVGFTRFERGMTMRTEAELTEWYDGTMYHIQQAQRATRENYFPMNPSSCGNYGGCEFRPVCGRDPGVRPNFLKGDFDKGGGYDPMDQR